MLKYCLMFLSTRKLGCFLWRKKWYRYNAVGHEFKVNESTVLYIQKKEEEIHWILCETVPETAKVTSEAMGKLEK